ncbi:nuclear transport factor 2 family protein [Chryseolinea sp. T2]|uniref:nuclear transport factor 2 family protein n=1 Tax=Chryseolinea sp. T2 TaxID=3129255 RepID=UPI0030784FEE
MKRLAFALIAAAICTSAGAQFANPELNAMVAAENAFIKMAKDKNTRDAFLYFLHDDAVTTDSNGPATGKERIRKQPPNPSLLSWEVAFGDISSGGDLGYDTGPWKFYPTRADSVPVAWGHFHSIWRKQPDGTWKNMLDIGISHDSLTVPEQLHTTSIPLKVPAVKVPALDATISLMNQEKAFLAAVKMNGMAAYGPVASKEIRFARQGEQPIITASDKEQFLKRVSLYSHQTLVDGGIASSGDLGYVYGTANVVAMVNGNEETKRATYLRIWKKENGKDWKIVLDVMTYN